MCYCLAKQIHSQHCTSRLSSSTCTGARSFNPATYNAGQAHILEYLSSSN